MKTKFTFLFLMLISNILFAQKIFIGGSGSISIWNTKSLTGIGLGVFGEYEPNSSPFSIRISTKVYNAPFFNSLYLGGYTHTFKIVESEILFLPFQGKGRIYAGIGLGYNFINIDRSGNVQIIESKYYVRSKNPQNALTYNIILGFRTETTFSIYFDLSYRITNLKYEVELEDQYSNKLIFDSRINLNSLLLNAGIRIRL
jgi:hypothetical protein